MSSIDKERLQQQCLSMKLKALEMTASTGSNGAHIGGGLSLVEIMAVLYAKANFAPDKGSERDRLILSKGHGALALYTALWQKGAISEDELLYFDKNGSELFGHPHRDINKGIEFSGGSLGLGLSYAVGVAISCRKKGLNNRIYAILGDGECNEGIVWEALMAASNFDLSNLTVIIDKNGYQLDGETKDIMNSESLAAKFQAFGFEVREIDGHSLEQIADALSENANGPLAIIANTVKANGISFLMNTKQSHHTSLSSKKYQQAVAEIKQAYGVE